MFSNGDRVYVARSRNRWEKNDLGKKGVVANFIGRDEQLKLQLDNNSVGHYSYFYQDELARLPRKGDSVLINDEKSLPHKGQVGTISLAFDSNNDLTECYYNVTFENDERGVLYRLSEFEIVDQSYTHIREFAAQYVQFCVFNNIRYDEELSREHLVERLEHALQALRDDPTRINQRIWNIAIQRQKHNPRKFEVSIVLGEVE